MENQLLEFAPDRPAVYFQYRVCANHFLWVCRKEEMRRIYYDLTDPAQRKLLIDKGIMARAWVKP